MICAVLALAITIPFEFAADQVFIPVRIKGGAPLWFSLDSAASSMIVDPAKARELGLTFGDAAQGRGAGAGGVAYVKLPDAIELTIGDTESGPYDFIAIDLSGPAKNASHAMDGILGYQFFSRFVVTIDYEHRTLTLSDPSEFREPRDATMLPLEIVSKLPFVTGKIKVSGVAPETSRFLIDTGSGDAVDHPLIKKSKGDVKRTVTGVGLGEPMTGWVGRADYLKLGPYTIRRPVTACCGGNEFNQRMIGAAILAQFTVTFDYAHRRLYLQPNRRYQH